MAEALDELREFIEYRVREGFETAQKIVENACSWAWLSADELKGALDQIALRTNSKHPAIVFVYAHGYQVGLGLGRKESFVHFELESGDPPYLITVGDSKADGVVAFYLHGIHHTEISRRHLISTAKARRILREWLQTASRSLDVEWEEV